MPITQNTQVKFTIGALAGVAIAVGGWAVNRLDAKVDAKADATALNDLVRTVADHSKRLTEEEQRAIRLETRREIDDRETADFKQRYAMDQAEIKAGIRRIEDAVLRGAGAKP